MINRLMQVAVVIIALCLIATHVRAEVSIREEKLTMPTWEIGAPAIHPLFPGPQGPIYPYTLNETLTDKKTDKTYNAVFLENEYIKVLVLPEIGGRVHGALDKSNQYVWLYWQKTIKPGLISMTGAWISGGIEWNFPHGHRPSGFMTVDHHIVRNPDGSATVWVGETEPIYRMRWLVGVTVFPGRSYFRCDYRFINPTNLKHPFQFWATSATHANDWAQAQYPGDMVTGHGKHEFWNWPVNNGVDLTWWKNVPNASSFFAFNNPSDWFGTYDHKAQGGMVHVASHQEMPGKKLFTWGSGPSGRIWEEILSEGGGAYFEPQAGAWSDNQPDYHWMAPQQVRTAHDYWYPVRDTRGYHNANQDFAVNTDLQNGTAFGAVYSTGVVRDYRVVLRDTKTNTVLTEKVTTMTPDKPFTTEVKAAVGATVYELHLAVYDDRGNLCIDLQQHPPRTVELPPGQKDPGDPKKMNQDELYHAGEWLDKYVRKEEGIPYYQEGLKKDPKDSRINLELGFLELKQGNWNEGLRFLNIASEKDSDNSRIFFGRGLAYAGLQKFQEAYDQFYRATYTYDYYAASYLNLARLDLRKHDYAGAVKGTMKAESQNGKFADIPALRAAALRHLGDHAKALESAERALEFDPMHFMGGYEKLLALKSSGQSTDVWENTWTSILRNSVQNYLELACAYTEAGLYMEADDILARVAEGKTDDQLYPMVNYLRGYFKSLQGDQAGSNALYLHASKGPTVYTNPHRLEEKAALESALRQNPKDAHAHLFLGNLLYGMGQQEAGLEHWKQAASTDPQLALAWRNIGYAENQLKKDSKASYAAYQKALSVSPADSRAMLEMDQVASQLKIPAAQRLSSLEAHQTAVQSRDDLVFRMIDLKLELGGEKNLEMCYDTLKTRHFHVWEGGYGIHHAWMETNQQLGDMAYARKNYSQALTYYQQAGEYPRNLEVAPRTPDFRAHVYWSLAKVYLALNQTSKANEYLHKILDEKYRKPHLGSYFQALAQKALKNDSAATTLLSSLEKTAREYTSGKFEYRGRQTVIGHYLLSLVLEEKGDKAAAQVEQRKALELDPQAGRLALTQAQIDYAGAHQ